MMKIAINNEGQYFVWEEEGKCWYGVVSKDVDKHCKYVLSEIEAYALSHPEDVVGRDWDKERMDALTIGCISQRRNAYTMESDPLFFGYQRGENTKEEWLAKIEEIKQRLPKPIGGL